ncbi:hypothetical protein Golob_024148 [Gossypium lobatum]|uniref:Uncharacterized protein n=2 Tax=Gossypium TaxID=3633 RepID=A0A7J8NIH7_9ROSI|nr:hypothetical protein [Gossypium lobatum]
MSLNFQDRISFLFLWMVGFISTKMVQLNLWICLPQLEGFCEIIMGIGLLVLQGIWEIVKLLIQNYGAS